MSWTKQGVVVVEDPKKENITIDSLMKRGEKLITRWIDASTEECKLNLSVMIGTAETEDGSEDHIPVLGICFNQEKPIYFKGSEMVIVLKFLTNTRVRANMEKLMVARGGDADDYEGFIQCLQNALDEALHMVNPH